MPDESVIKVRGLVTRFGTNTIHDHLDLDVRRGEILAIVGGSGSGKSVMLQTLIGLKRPEGGTIEVFGQDIGTLSEPDLREIQKRWGVLFQGGALFSALTVAQNVRVPFREHTRLPAKLVGDLIRLKIRLVGLPAEAGAKYPAELSGGMIKRAGLGRALALDPEIVFLDEPTSGLDPISAGDFDELIRTLQQTLGLTVFMVTHDLESLYTACDRVAALADGKVVAEGPLEVMLECEHPWVKTYFKGKRGGLLADRQLSA